MAQKINLALLNKKKEELAQTEMKEIRGGSDCSCYEPDGDLYIDGEWLDRTTGFCNCGSIWMFFGMDV